MNNRKLRVESLEERTLLAVVAGGIEQAAEFAAPTEATIWIVNTLEDPTRWNTADDVLSLREAIGSASTGDTIVFDDSLTGGTITLSGSPLEVYQGITLDATSIGGITIDANGKSRVIYVGGGSAENPVELIGLTITGSSNEYYGGGIFNDSTLILTDSTVSGNIANYGGGILNTNSGTLTLANSTVSGNAASSNGGGIYNSGTLTITNTILSLNYATYDNDIYNNSASVSVSHSIIGLDPGFVIAPIFVDGILVNADELDLSLTAESIAIDRGTNDTVETKTDFAGNPRIIAAWRETPTVDIGAYEYQGRVEQEDIPLTIVTTDLDIVDAHDGLVSLREAIFYNTLMNEAITFDASLMGKTIFLDGTQLEINIAITIDASSIGGITIHGNGQSRVFYIGSDASVDLFDLTIAGGWTEGDGGGIYVAAKGNLTLTGTTVTKNIATNYGGGIYVAKRGNLTLTNCTVTNDYASRGGGIFNDNFVTLTLTNSTVSGNTADYGAGICNNSGTVMITDSTISGNTAKSGGGIFNSSGTLTLTGSIVSGNSTSSTFNGYSGGGIYNNNTGKLTLTDSTVSGNTAKYGGGGIGNHGTLTLTNSTISGNSVVDSNGGGIGNSGSLILTNTIVSLNHAKWDNDIFDQPNSMSGSNNLIGLDPGFVTAPVFENGRLINADELDLSLTSGSVAIDGGTNDVVETETDCDENPRIVAAWREIATVDIGAYEYQGAVTRGGIETPSTVVTTVLDLVDETDGLISLREAISYATAGDTVTFAPSLASETIVLDGAELVIDKNLSIDASALGGITIDGDARSGIFMFRNASGRVTVRLTALAIRNGRAASGGGIYNDGVILSLTNCTVTKGYAYNGGGIYNNSGTITMTNTTVVDNSAYNGESSALYISGGTITFYNSVIMDKIQASSTRTYAYNTLSRDFTNWTQSLNCPDYDWSLPLFADPSHNDYTLAENSQAINKGNNDYVTTETDLAGNPRILNGIVDLGAYEYTGQIDPLDSPTILTGSRGYYVSYGANRHQVEWSAVDRATAYEFAYSEDGGSTWTTLETNDTSAVVRGLAYGEEVSYRVRALSTRYLENSEWSATKTFNVCPMDINNDGDISGPDRSLMATAWGREIGDEKYRFYADINGDGDISGPDRNILGTNWGLESDDPNLLYPRPVAADLVFAEFESADIDFDADAF